MKNYQIKNTEVGVNTVKDIDKKSRVVKVAISRMGNLDLDNDIIDKGAYNRTINHRGPNGKNLIWHLTDHVPSLKSAVGKFKNLSVEDDYLVGTTEIPNTTWGNDMMEFYDKGHINQHSVGFSIVDSEPVNKGKDDEYRLIKEISLYEGSAVLWGANPDTPTMEVGKSLTKEQVEKDFLETVTELSNFTKLFKSGHLSDQSFELIEIKITQLTDKLQQLFEKATRLAVKAPGSAVESVVDVLTTFTNNLQLQNYARGINTRTAAYQHAGGG